MKPRNYMLDPDMWVPLLLTVGALALLNLALCPVPFRSFGDMPTSWPTSAGIGLLLAQGSLLNLALVFGSGPFWLRLSVVVGASSLVLFTWYGGDFVPSPAFNSSPPVPIATLAFAVLLAISGQAPLWLARIAFGWRFAGDVIGSNARQKQFSLADLLAALVACAMAMGLFRAGLLDPGAKRLDDHWFELLLTALAGAFGTILLIMPLVGIFFSRMPLIFAWVVAIHIAVFQVALGQLLFWADFGAMFTFTLVLTITIGASSSVMRCCGVGWHNEIAMH